MEYKSAKEPKLLMLGLDKSGKTTILSKLYEDKAIDYVKSYYNDFLMSINKIEFQDNQFLMFDISGDEKIRIMWRNYYDNCHGLIFVIDCTDKDRLDTAKGELERMFGEE